MLCSCRHPPLSVSGCSRRAVLRMAASTVVERELWRRSWHDRRHCRWKPSCSSNAQLMTEWPLYTAQLALQVSLRCAYYHDTVLACTPCVKCMLCLTLAFPLFVASSSLCCAARTNR